MPRLRGGALLRIQAFIQTLIQALIHQHRFIGGGEIQRRRLRVVTRRGGFIGHGRFFCHGRFSSHRRCLHRLIGSGLGRCDRRRGAGAGAGQVGLQTFGARAQGRGFAAGRGIGPGCMGGILPQHFGERTLHLACAPVGQLAHLQLVQVVFGDVFFQGDLDLPAAGTQGHIKAAQHNDHDSQNQYKNQQFP